MERQIVQKECDFQQIVLAGNNQIFKCKRISRKEMLEIKNALTEMKNALMGSAVDWKWPGKESVSLKLCQ